VGGLGKDQSGGILLLTAAVSPSPGIGTSLSSPRERARQYQVALASWLDFAHATSSRVVVVETTGATIEDLVPRNYDGLNFELLPHAPSDSMLAAGKGAVEAAAIDHVLDTLDVAGSTVITKVTGRLSLRNPADVLQQLPPRTVAVRRTLDRRFADTRLVQTDCDTWKSRLHGMAEEVDERAGDILELVLAQRLIVAEYRRQIVVRSFPSRPSFLGASGTSGQRYDGLRQRVVETMSGLVEPKLDAIKRKQT